MTALISVRDVTRSFGGVQAVSNCSMDVDEGKVTGLIGPNGAGKTTMLEMIAGALPPDSGTITFGGHSIAGAGRTKIARLGLVRTFQMARPLATMPLLENVVIGQQQQAGENLVRLFSRKWRREESGLLDRAEQCLAAVGLEEKRDHLGGELSGGQQKLLEMARLMMANPRMVLLDEPIAGVNPKLAGELAKVIRGFLDRHVSVLVVEHNLNFVDQTCDEVIVMTEGSVLVRGTLKEVRSDRRVINAYLGVGV
jgi:ABC-type branched-subunit amino acid transport system ATPase component